MSDEPIYEFVKGKGWAIIPPQETYTEVVDGVKITLIKRPPLPTERGWFAYPAHSSSLANVLKDIVFYGVHRGILGWSGDYYRSPSVEEGWDYAVTVLVES